MSLSPIIMVETFNIYAIDFMGPFPTSFRNEYILLAINYVFKKDVVILIRTNKARAIVKFLRENIFSRYDMHYAIISDQDIHFNN